MLRCPLMPIAVRWHGTLSIDVVPTLRSASKPSERDPKSPAEPRALRADFE